MLQEMGVHVWLPESGMAVLERAPASVQSAPARSPQAAPAARVQPPADTAPPPVRPASVTALAIQTQASTPTPDWSTLTDAVRSCQACALCAGRSHTTLVPLAADAARCDWMVLGDPPDEDEDRAGAPFAGHDGVLLANMLRALGLQQANLPSAHAAATAGVASAVDAAAVHALPPARRAYVSNVLKCRPAHGAIAQAAELAACSAWLQREIALVQPKIILSLGRFANQVLLGETPQLATLPLGKLRGTVHRYQGVAVVVSYPPKLLMRNSADKAKAWADLCLAALKLAP